MKSDTQVLYKGRFVSREHFCAFVFNTTGQKLAKSYDEFSALISSGVWFTDVKDVPATKVDKEPAEVDKVVQLKSKRGSKCQNRQQQ